MLDSTAQRDPATLWRRVVGWDLGGVLLPVVLISAALVVTSPGFLSAYSMNSILAAVAITALVGLGQVVVLAVGHFNLAIGSMGVLTGAFVGWAMDYADLPVLPSILAGLLVGGGLGMAQGLLIVRANLNPFIVTLALASVYQGLMLLVTRGQTFHDLPPEFTEFGRGGVAFIPNIAIVMFVVAVGVAVVVQRTGFGRELLATGESPRAAQFSGINSGRIVLLAHTLSGTVAAVAAVLAVARLAEAHSALGQDWLLPSFAAPVLGGTLLSGGRISVAGTVLGALMLSLIQNLLVLAGISQHWYQAGLGLLIIGAVGLERFRALVATR